MSHLPEKGEARAAADVMDARLKAANTGRTDEAFVEMHSRTGEMRGDSHVMYAAYGDLFDVGDLVPVALAPVRKFIVDIAQGQDPESALCSMYMLAVAHGVMIERRRWERGR